MKIFIIPHNQQRYNTVGDYYQKGSRKRWYFYISDLGDWRYNWCVALHEIIECYLCSWLGIKEEDIMTFDLMFEKERDMGLWKDEEPGFDKRAPYRKQHIIATVFEMILCFLLFASWKKYSDTVNEIS